uniref:Major facilitator superfamily (MFS) profile domain-containing protein n=1 Tax=Chromera velia CCMP2878 TaxID=1169474 RepID=A0A0G4I790_9ALVE|eukprot:Cvel_11537.t1-p1 / transcript=Cvel_11537.t1 / gene=Cvel_11537 / organism=Chromera_velia_CCMP2878 / gene_product=High affinity nitrate transporter 2.7, putative / transcript_product=High affinity nitrate transporter 2.7, putative / location=Cvel_scaffold728:39889-41777(+) / protein_length=522 / sequence_SO=supercontig / SO=protein_coding / is_pseudo=false
MSASGVPKLGFFGKPPQDASGKALGLRLFNFSAPNMKNFHWAWLTFHIGFFSWYSIAGLSTFLYKKGETEGYVLTEDSYATSVMFAVASTIIMRFAFGPICDAFGPRLSQAFILVFGSIPVACFALAMDSHVKIYILRFAIGFLGASFVPCQFFTSQFFAPSVVGSANAFSGGWGNLGAGVTMMVMPNLMRIFTDGLGMSDNDALKWVFLIPAAVTCTVGVLVFFFADDSPQGCWKNRALPGETSEEAAERCRIRDEKAAAGVKEEAKEKVPFSQSGLAKSLYDVVKNPNTAVLAFSYMASFGVEMTLNNFMPAYFLITFPSSGITRETAIMLAGALAWLNLFARACGGILSDQMNAKLSMSGRIITHFCALTLEGAFLMLFTFMPNIWAAFVVAVIFSLFAQAANGTCYSIVPSVSPYKGMISGLVGAGGNLGVVIFAIIFKNFPGESMATGFQVVAIFCFAAAASSFLLRLNGQWIIPNAATREALAPAKVAPKEVKHTESTVTDQVTLPAPASAVESRA